MTSTRTIYVSVIGVSGKDSVKGAQGVGKSLLCNRFVRGAYEDFYPEHSSVLSQTDFGGSPVINNDHWLYWGERLVEADDVGTTVDVAVVEQTEFLDDETFDTIAGPSTSESYSKRAVRVKLESRDKLMYIQRDQLGLEAEFPQKVLPDGKCHIDCFVCVFDTSHVDGRPFSNQVNSLSSLLANAAKTKKPVVLALSKFDAADGECRRAVQLLMQRKELKAVHLQMVECSAMVGVNVDEVFLTAVNLALKDKIKLKVLPYALQAKRVAQRNMEIRGMFVHWIRSALPVDTWPMMRISWKRLLCDFGLERDAIYLNFVRIFGRNAAYKVYEQHVNEIKEHWMDVRQRAMLQRLPRIFSAMFDMNEVQQMSWAEAKEVMRNHALSEEFIQPLGMFARDLEPLKPGEHIVHSEDPRIPAELLMRNEARFTFQQYQAAVLAEQRKERLEENFEDLLADTPQVTPGKPLQDVCLFLQGSGIYESLAPSQATLVYDRFQNDLVKKAEVGFLECLQENIELFLEMVRGCEVDVVSGRFLISDSDFSFIREQLQEDYRYRQLSRLFELRDNMIWEYASFVASPLIQNCPAGGRCIDANIQNSLAQFFQRRKLSLSATHVVDMTVHGELDMVAQFITDINGILRDEPFLCSSGNASIRCFGADENELCLERPRTQLYLIDSPLWLDYARHSSARMKLSSQCYLSVLPAVFVLVCHPAHYDLLPFLHQQTLLLADNVGGILIPGRSGESESDDSRWSGDSIFCRDQLLRVCDTVCMSQLDKRICEMRVQVSLSCGDALSIESVMQSLLCGDTQRLRPIVNPSLLPAGVVPVDVTLPSAGRAIRAEVSWGSYHQWLMCPRSHNCNAHVIVYSSRRSASFAQARAAVGKVLEEGCPGLTGRTILLVAVIDGAEAIYEESSILVTEGEELAQSIGATFLTVSSSASTASSTTTAGSEAAKTAIHFLDLVHSVASDPLRGSSTQVHSGAESDGYATLDNSSRMNYLAGTSHTPPYERPMKPASQNVYVAYRSSNSTNPSVIGAARTDSRGGNSMTSSRKEMTQSVTSPVTSPMSPPISVTGSYRSNATNNSSGNRSNTSVSSRPRRRVAPAIPPIRLPHFRDTMMVAPLATPEAVDVVPEYSNAQDALTDEEHIYATLDLAESVSFSASRVAEKTSSGSDNSLGKKDKKRLHKGGLFSSSSQSSTPTSSESASSTSAEILSPQMNTSITSAGGAVQKFEPPPPGSYITFVSPDRVPSRRSATLSRRGADERVTTANGIPDRPMTQRVSPGRRATTSTTARFLMNVPGLVTNDTPPKRVTSPLKVVETPQKCDKSPQQRVISPPQQRVISSPQQRINSPPQQRVNSPPQQRITSPPKRLESRVSPRKMTSSTQPVWPVGDAVVKSSGGLLGLFGTRSQTMDVINRDTVVKAREMTAERITARKAVRSLAGAGAPLRQSMSAESIRDLLDGEGKKSQRRFGGRFVRKVTSSFRFKKQVEDEALPAGRIVAAGVRAIEGSRSLPQSPHLDRKQQKKYGTLASSEKVCGGSGAFSWLPSRSPKRTQKTNDQSAAVSVKDSLFTICARSPNRLPTFLIKCIEFIEKEGGLELEGLYRVPGNQAQLLELEKAFREKVLQEDVDLWRVGLPVQVVATGVKNFFNSLPDPLIPEDLQSDVVDALGEETEEQVIDRLRDVIQMMPEDNRRVLNYFTKHLDKVASSPATAMDRKNLSKVFFPTLLRPQFVTFEEMSVGTDRFQKAMEAIFIYSDRIF